MDVSCPSCRSEYELDDARVPADGVTVKCANCKHVFRVKRREEKTDPAVPAHKPGGSDLPPAPPSREWKVRQPGGNIYACRELTTLQKWIIEGKVGRDDEISLSGETWKRLGNIPELASFFQVFEEASRARSYEAIRAATGSMPALVLGGPQPPTQQEPAMQLPPEPPPPSVPTQPEAPPPKAPPPPAPVPSASKAKDTLRGAVLPPLEASPTKTLQGARFSEPPPQAPKPSPRRSVEPDEFDEQLARGVRSSGRGVWIALLIAGLGLGGGLGYYFGMYLPEQEQKLADQKAAEQQRLADEEKKRKDAEARVKALEEQEKARALAAAAADAGQDGADGGAASAAVDAGASAVVDAGAPSVSPVVDAGTVAALDAGAPVVGKGGGGGGVAPKSFDALLLQADKMRNADQPAVALNLYGKAAELRPDSAEPLAGKGLCLLDMGRPAAAQVTLEQAVTLNPNYGPAIMGLAEAYRANGNTSKALEYYQKYLDVLPNGPEAAVAKSQLERLKK